MNQPTGITLLMSSRNTEDNQLIWQAAVKRGWSVERVHGLRVPDVSGSRILMYMESLFAPTIAKQFGLLLLQPSESWLPELPEEYRLREIALTTLAEIQQSQLPQFLKPPIDKSFPAKVYKSLEDLLNNYAIHSSVLVATPVEWSVEYRCFCLDGRVRTLSPYCREGELSSLNGFTATSDELREATRFAEQVLGDARVDCPKAIVLDVGKIIDRGWAVVEANAAWGSGVYGCDPDEVLSVIERAIVTTNELSN